MKPCIHICILATLLFLIGPVQSAEKPKLKILNWSSDYIEIDPEADASLPIAQRSPTLREFAEKFQCTIEYDEYDTEDEMFQQVQNLPHYYDVVVMTTDTIGKMRTADRLMKLDPALNPNQEHIFPKYRQIPEDPAGEYFLPYLVGTTGIIYRQDLVGQPVVSWQTFFEPPAHLKGRLACLDTNYMVYFAMQYLGIDIHTTDSAKIKQAARLFFDLKKNGFLALISSDLPKSLELLSNGELAMVIMYSGEAISHAKDDPERRLHYILPREGAEYFVDSLTVLKDAPQPELAMQFLNFWHDPKVQARNVLFLNYATANRKALEELKITSPAYIADPAINISEEMLQRLEIFTEPNDEIRRLWDKIRSL